MTTDDVVQLLRDCRFRQNRERDLQDGVEGLLRTHGMEYRREHWFDPINRVDFWLPGIGLALEIKVAGSLTDVAMQLDRYAAVPSVRSLILLTGRRGHGALPATVRGKPLTVVYARKVGL